MHAHPLIHNELARQRVRELRRGGAERQPSARPAHKDAASSPEVAALVQAASTGDAKAWESLVARLSPLLRATARSYRLSPADVEDVVQSAWTSAFIHIGSLREPQAIGGWMMVTTRREALRMIERRSREIPVDDAGALEEGLTSMPETTLFADEQRAAVHAAIERLPDHQRHLIRALYDEMEPSYDEIAASLGLPVGSIGPTRQRALARLRRDRNLAVVAA